MASAGGSWATIAHQKKAELQKLKIPANVNIENFDQFNKCLENLCKTYAEKGLARFVRDRLSPILDHVRSFAGAINAASQTNEISGLVWSGLQVVIEVACRFADALDSTFAFLTNLHDRLPQFEEYITMYPTDKSLNDTLLLLYKDYIDFCIAQAVFLSRGVLRNVIRSLYSSSYTKTLKKITAQVDDHSKMFESKAALASRRKVEQNHTQVMQRIAPATALQVKGSVDTFIVPYRRNPGFFGRATSLSDIHDTFSGTAASLEPISVVLHGMGGVGKTQTALEYAYKYRSSYDYVLWLPAEDAVLLERSYVAIAVKLGIVEDQATLGQKAKECLLDWFKRSDRTWLLVFDNVESWDSISTYWPSTCTTRASIVVTTQKPADMTPWSGHDINLEHFDVNQGAEFLLDRVKINKPTAIEVDEAQSIVKLVDGLPVFLAHIAGHITQSQSSMREYIQLFHESSDIWQMTDGGANWMYERAVNAVFDVALAELSEPARRLVYTMAFLNPDGVPERLLFSGQNGDELEYLQCPDRRQFLSITADLHSRQLVKRENPNDAILTIHRSLQEGILQKLNRDEVERSRAFECALQALRRVIPQASYLIQAEPLKWKETEPHLPQLLSLRRAFSRSTPRIQASVSFAQLLYDVGMNMWDRGLADDGQKVLTTAEEILDAVRIPQEHILRANINLVLSLFGEDVGISCRRETLQRRERALNIRQSLWDATPLDQRSHDDEVLIYAAIVDLACSYQQYNNYDKVRELIEASLKKYHEWGNHDTIPFEFAKYYRLDAYAHIFEGDTKAAVQSMKKAAELQAMADPTALMANFFQCDWAIMLAQNGQWDEAIGRLHAICEYRETTCGKLSVLTLQAHLILGIFYFHQKQYDNALPLIREVLRKARQACLNEETIVRVKFYLSETLVGKSSLLTSGDDSLLNEAKALRCEADTEKDRLMSLDPLERANLAPCTDDTIYDYLVAAEFRVSHMHKALTAG